MKKGQVTIKDIARELGISPSTVSKALKEHPDISRATKKADRICEEIETDRVIVDDDTGAYEAVKHLINIGCRNIIHLSGPADVNIGKNRKNGYIRALKDHRIPVLEENIINCDTSGEAARIIPGLLNRKEKPDGIFAVNDLTAAEAMKIVKQHGYRVPEDIAIVGFTSGMISDITDPSLTSVEQHGYTIGVEAVKLLIGRIEGKKEMPFETKIIRTELVIKDSTKRDPTIPDNIKEIKKKSLFLG